MQARRLEPAMLFERLKTTDDQITDGLIKESKVSKITRKKLFLGDKITQGEIYVDLTKEKVRAYQLCFQGKGRGVDDIMKLTAL